MFTYDFEKERFPSVGECGEGGGGRGRENFICRVVTEKEPFRRRRRTLRSSVMRLELKKSEKKNQRHGAVKSGIKNGVVCVDFFISPSADFDKYFFFFID